MDSSSSRGKRPELYSTVVVHGGDGSVPDPEVEEEEEDAASLPPLLQRLPKDFGGASEDDEDDDGGRGASFSGTVIVRREPRPSPSPTARRTLRSPFLDLKRSSPRSPSDADDAYSTFLIRSTVRSGGSMSPRESLSGTAVRRTSSGGGGGGFGSSFMSEAVESMRGGMGDGGGEEGRQQQPRRKASVSSVPDSLAKEDPSTKYELLHELGEISFKLFQLGIVTKWV